MDYPAADIRHHRDRDGLTPAAGIAQVGGAVPVPGTGHLPSGAARAGGGWCLAQCEPFKGRFWTLSSWTDQEQIAAYSASEPHRSTVAKLKPRMAGSRFLLYQVTGKPDWKDAIARIKAADAVAV